MVKFKFCVTLALLAISSFYVNHCSACNGYKMHLISVENCSEDNVVTIDKNFTATLSDDCILTTTGCVSSKGFKEAKVKYSVKKDGNELFSGHPDVCRDILDHKTKEQKEKLEMFGFPTECPVPEGRSCMDGTKKVDITKYKNMLQMAVGKITVHHDIQHDTGKTCVEITFEVTKNP